MSQLLTQSSIIIIRQSCGMSENIHEAFAGIVAVIELSECICDSDNNDVSRVVINIIAY